MALINMGEGDSGLLDPNRDIPPLQTDPTPSFPTPNEPKSPNVYQDPTPASPGVNLEPYGAGHPSPLAPGVTPQMNYNLIQALHPGYDASKPPGQELSGAGGSNDLMSRIQAQLASARSSDDPNYWFQKISADPNGAGSAWGYWADRINRGDGSQLGLARFQDSSAPSGQSAMPGTSTPNTSVFSDPATQQYEQMLNAMMGKLNTPYQAPDMQPALDYLKSYFQQLQGPAYTPQQMDTMQTQSLDPQTVQRDAARQQILEHFAKVGVPASSGIVQQALLNSDQNFEKLRTTTQANFATNAVGMQKQQQAQAAQLGPMIAALENQQFAGNEGRQLQATQMGSIVPNMAWNRIQGANSMVQPINTGSLISQLLGAQQQGYNNSAGYTSGLMQLLMQLVGA